MSEIIMVVPSIRKEKGILHCCSYTPDGLLQIIRAYRKQKGTKNKDSSAKVNVIREV